MPAEVEHGEATATATTPATAAAAQNPHSNPTAAPQTEDFFDSNHLVDTSWCNAAFNRGRPQPSTVAPNFDDLMAINRSVEVPPEVEEVEKVYFPKDYIGVQDVGPTTAEINAAFAASRMIPPAARAGLPTVLKSVPTSLLTSSNPTAVKAAKELDVKISTIISHVMHAHKALSLPWFPPPSICT